MHWELRQALGCSDLFLSSQNSHVAGTIDIMLVVTGALIIAKKFS